MGAAVAGRLANRNLICAIPIGVTSDDPVVTDCADVIIAVGAAEPSARWESSATLRLPESQPEEERVPEFLYAIAAVVCYLTRWLRFFFSATTLAKSRAEVPAASTSPRVRSAISAATGADRLTPFSDAHVSALAW